METERNPIIQLKGITKRFGSKVLANDDVTMDIYEGEILALLGENGSGKTTLLNMLSGIYFPDSGEIFVRGEHVSIRSPHDAYLLGIGMIHQHFKLVNVFTATENIMLGLNEGFINDFKKTQSSIRGICDLYGFELDPDQKVYDMSVSQKQTLEIVKALYRGADILILDEPTAVLTPQETERLFTVIRNMRSAGKTVIIITHKLQEVLEISDRVAILRKGRYIGSVPTSEATELSLTEMMVGQKVELNIDRPEPKNRELRLSVSNLSCKNAENIEVLKNVSFNAFSGEILGIAGISGCGQKELLESIAGLHKPEPGAEIVYISPEGENESLIGKSPKKIRSMGVSLSFVPEDRIGMGLVGSMGMTDNMLLKTYNKGISPIANKKPSKRLAEHIREELDVATPSIGTPVRMLSGGNVQKVLVGRELSSSPTLLMTAYAVRGLDINTSYVIYRLLNEQKEKGVSVIFVGEDLDVLLALSDRILVLCGGRVSGILDARTTTKEEVGYLMTNIPETTGGAL